MAIPNLNCYYDSSKMTITLIYYINYQILKYRDIYFIYKPQKYICGEVSLHIRDIHELQIHNRGRMKGCEGTQRMIHPLGKNRPF